MKHIDKGVRDRLCDIMTYEGNSVVSAPNYAEIMKPMACFSATDVNSDNELDTSELKLLFWLLNGKEPEHAYVLKELSMIDKDASGTIDRLEFI